MRDIEFFSICYTLLKTSNKDRWRSEVEMNWSDTLGKRDEVHNFFEFLDIFTLYSAHYLQIKLQIKLLCARKTSDVSQSRLYCYTSFSTKPAKIIRFMHPCNNKNANPFSFIAFKRKCVACSPKINSGHVHKMRIKRMLALAYQMRTQLYKFICSQINL